MKLFNYKSLRGNKVDFEVYGEVSDSQLKTVCGLRFTPYDSLTSYESESPRGGKQSHPGSHERIKKIRDGSNIIHTNYFNPV